jgi:SAM-dependent methyltransferase
MDGCADVDWSSVAPDWDRLRTEIEETKVELTERFLAALPPLAGRRVLELGSGTGELAATLSVKVGATGNLIASDAAEGMVKLLTTRLGALDNVETASIDARDIPLPDASVDTVVFRMGLMLVPEPAVALAEIRRVLRPGGTFVTAVWGAPEFNPWLTSVGMSAMMHGLVTGGPPVGPGMPFSLADPAALVALVTDAGFGGVRVETVDSHRLFRSSGAHFDQVRALAPPLAEAFSAADPAKVAAVRATVTGLTEQYAGPDGLRLPLRALICSGARP